MDKTGPNPPTRRDHLIPPVPRAKQLPPAGTNTNQKGCQFNKQKKEPSKGKQRSKRKSSSTNAGEQAKQSEQASKQYTHQPQTVLDLTPPKSNTTARYSRRFSS